MSAFHLLVAKGMRETILCNGNFGLSISKTEVVHLSETFLWTALINSAFVHAKRSHSFSPTRCFHGAGKTLVTDRVVLCREAKTKTVSFVWESDVFQIFPKPFPSRNYLILLSYTQKKEICRTHCVCLLLQMYENFKKLACKSRVPKIAGRRYHKHHPCLI